MYKSIEPSVIIDTVCRVMDITDIKTQSKKTEYVYARFIVIGILRKHTKLSYIEIGDLINRDRTSVYFGDQRSARLVVDSAAYAYYYNKSKKELEGLCA